MLSEMHLCSQVRFIVLFGRVEGRKDRGESQELSRKSGNHYMKVTVLYFHVSFVCFFFVLFRILLYYFTAFYCWDVVAAML